jgi:hypothetical protein
MTRHLLAIIWLVAVTVACLYATRDLYGEETKDMSVSNGIRPYEKNPFYWQYRGKPIVLIGGSDMDNLFQWTGSKLTDHLDLLVSSGGNYVRNTMSSRNHAFPYNDDGMAYPFRKREDGKYDLDQWDDDYWNRLDTFLAETHKRGIIVQHELWDMYAVTGRDAWKKQPWNPENSVNYILKSIHAKREGFHHPFFLAVTELDNDPVLISYQTKYIRKMLQICLKYDHVLYQLDNESPFPPEVSDYWAEFIHKEGGDKQVYVCDSRRFHSPSPVFTDFRDMSNPDHNHPLSHPEIYNYTDISQNGGNTGQTHYGNLVWFRSQLLDDPRPINHTKIYQFNWPTGVDWRDRSQGIPKDGADKFWRNIFGGAASARHHRHVPREGWGGIGLTPFGQRQLRSMRMLLDAMWIFTMEPCNDLLSHREEDEAYAIAEPGKQYAVYFTGYGDRSVQIDLAAASGHLVERWLDIGNSLWGEESVINGGDDHKLTVPGNGQWAVLLRKKAISPDGS